MPLMESVTMLEFQEGLKKSKTALLPCGSLEEHGPHLPLGTDTWHALEIAKAVSEKIFVWVAPPIFYGLCRSSSKHPGTVGIRGTTLRLLIKDVVKSLNAQGIENVLILSGHAGGTHMAMIVDACEELMEEISGLYCAVLSVLDIGRKVWKDVVETPRDSHAGEVETSVMMYLFPQYVADYKKESYPTFPDFILVRDKLKYWPDGVWGDPSKASPEKGKKLFDRAVEMVIDVVRTLEAKVYV